MHQSPWKRRKTENMSADDSRSHSNTTRFSCSEKTVSFNGSLSEGKMARSTGNNNVNLLKLVEERALSKKVEEEKKKQELLVPYLPKDCISNILIRLPLQSLSSARFVCKQWLRIINSSNFIDAYHHRSESVLIFLKSAGNSPMRSTPAEQSNIFSVEESLEPVNFNFFDPPKQSSSSKFHIQFMEFEEGKSKTEEYNVSCLGSIKAACNGLILLDKKLTKELAVMNPVTRKLIAFPVGTIYPRHESYGFALSEGTGEYKVVHLFRYKRGECISCEILNLATRRWRGVKGPSSDLFSWLGYKPVSAIGALHWIPKIRVSDYIVSMEVDNEMFHKVSVPKACGTHDRIIEKGGFLCFVKREELNIDIWILKSLFGEGWTKYHRITTGSIIDIVPLFSLKVSGDMIFVGYEDGSFYRYDFILQDMTKVEMENGRFLLSGSYFPHVNSLVSWDRSQALCD